MILVIIMVNLRHTLQYQWYHLFICKLYYFRKVEEDATGRFPNLFINMCENDGSVNIGVASDFVCKMYGQPKENDVDEARHSKLMQMTGKVDKVSSSYT